MKYLFLAFLLISFSGNAQDLGVILDSALQSGEKQQYFFSEAKKLINNNKDKADYLFALHRYHSIRNERDSMLLVEKELIPLLDSFSDRIRKSNVFERIAYYYESAGLYDQAIQHYLMAVEEILPTNRAELISDLYRSLSQVHRLFKDYDKAVFYGKKSFEAVEFEEDKFLTYKSRALNIIGAAFSEMKIPDSTVYYYNRVLEFIPALDSMTVAPTIVNAGYAYLLKGDIEKARDYTNAGLRLYEKSDNDYAKAVIYINLGMIENAAKNYPLALALLDSGIVYTEKSQYAELYTWIYDEQSKIYKATGNYPKAISSMENLLGIKDSLFVSERAKVAKDLEIKFQTALKDQEIKDREAEILEKEQSLQRVLILTFLLMVIVSLLITVHFLNKNRFKKKQQILQKEKELSIKEAYLHAALESQETERKRFAQDLHDGFGQLISALQLNILQIRNKTNLEEKLITVERSELILKEMHSEIRNIAFNLMPATLIRSGLKEAISEFAHRIHTSGAVKVETYTHGLEERLSEMQEISLYRVIQEWVNNILKYAEATSITIQLVRHEDEVSIMIEDDGRGFDPAILEKGKGNGWRNIQSRLQRISATWELDSQPDRRGSTMLIFLPIPSKEKLIAIKQEK
ncbi:sensor histidine kinase [Aquiflexum gelatinilyticum]|uniref:sensor histidine kinase n=1 Tax=Aquiflexum gelatinilyticum TaxID=2961943 RepID=UPI002167DC6C|nr:sensor histidine kinase [Aquiflexum gelatinilyticum]MCS4435449.1 sensor histidine kinase [Aquiflexum gelatinilyticum]